MFIYLRFVRNQRFCLKKKSRVFGHAKFEGIFEKLWVVNIFMWQFSSVLSVKNPWTRGFKRIVTKFKVLFKNRELQIYSSVSLRAHLYI